jgi:ATP-binding cassette, subfamily B, bacterial
LNGLPAPVPSCAALNFAMSPSLIPARIGASSATSISPRPGERVALIGENGQGKTTVVKLITRLYDPTEGQILLDGVDLREYDLADLHAEIGVIFQDFMRYEMTARENIASADRSAAHCSEESNTRRKRALRRE